MKLHSDLREFVELLNSLEIEYLVVGGHAVAFHGHPRFTGDLDFWLASTPTNAARAVEAVRRFGFGDLGFVEADLLVPGQIIQLGRPPNRIDLLSSISGVEFADAWQHRVPGTLDGLPVAYLGLEDLLVNERVSGRAKDLADVKKLVAIHSGQK